MISHTSPEFRDSFRKLNPEIQLKVQRAYELFKDNPRHPGLKFKRVQGMRNRYSVRIDSNYRALGRVHGNVIIWYWVGPHNEYDRMMP